MIINQKRILLAVFFCSFPLSTPIADYIATEQPYAYVCKSYILFSSCAPVSISAVRDRDGKLFEMRTTFPDDWITEYSNQVCTIQMKRNNSGNMSALFGKSQQLLSKDEKGVLYVIEPEYIQFNCRKTT